jgi:predicted MFS family arabinose efflux permease
LGKRIIAALGFGYFVNSAQELSISLNFPVIRSAFSPALPLSALAVINGWRIIIQTLVTPLWGMAADRFSRKKILVVGVGLWGGLAVLCGLASSYAELFAAWVVCCLGFGALVPAGFGMLSDLYGPQERGRAIGILNAIGMLGIFAAALGSGALIEAFPVEGWKLVFFTIGGVSILSALVMAIFIKEPARGSAEPELESVITDLAASRFRFKGADILEVLKIPTIWIAYLQGCLALAGLYLLMNYFTSWLTESLKLAASTADNLFAVVIIGLVIGSILGGMASDWAEKKYSSKGRIMVAQFSLAVLVPAMLGFIFLAKSVGPVVVFAFAIAFFVDWTRRSALQPMIQNVTAPELRGTALALAEFFMGGGSMLLVMGFAKFADKQGLLKTFLYFGCGSWVLAFLAGFLLYLAYPRDYAKLRVQMETRRNIITGEVKT